MEKMTYAKIFEGAILEVGPRPQWFLDDKPVSDEVLRAGGVACDSGGNPIMDSSGNFILAEGNPGWVPVVPQDVPYIDPLVGQLTWNSQSDWIVEPDKVIQTHTVRKYSLLETKEKATALVDSLADEIRQFFVTEGGPGQALEYGETKAEARRWQEDPAPDIQKYPMLRAEYRARLVADPHITVEQVVSDSLAEIELWTSVGASIKEARRTAKVAIEVAETSERVRDIVDWASSAYQQIVGTGSFTPLGSFEPERAVK